MKKNIKEMYGALDESMLADIQGGGAKAGEVVQALAYCAAVGGAVGSLVPAVGTLVGATASAVYCPGAWKYFLGN